jgi:hypothetical protein
MLNLTTDSTPKASFGAIIEKRARTTEVKLTHLDAVQGVSEARSKAYFYTPHEHWRL